MDCVEQSTDNQHTLHKCYVSKSSSQQSKDVIYTTNIYARLENEGEEAFIERFKKGMNPELVFSGNIKERHESLYGFEYRTMSYKHKDVRVRMYFFFRRQDVVLLDYKYLESRESEFLPSVKEAVNNFYWDGYNFEIPQLGIAKMFLPYNMYAFWNNDLNRLEFTPALTDFGIETEMLITLEKTAELPRLDTLQYRKGFEEELKRFPDIRLSKKQLGTYLYETHKADFYVFEFMNEDKNYEMHIYDVFIGNKVFRLTTTTIKGKIDRLKNGLLSIKMSIELVEA